MEISKLVRRLNDNEISQYEDKGYIKGLPVFSLTVEFASESS